MGLSILSSGGCREVRCRQYRELVDSAVLIAVRHRCASLPHASRPPNSECIVLILAKVRFTGGALNYDVS
jgi:hypothetical protein